MNRKFAQLSEEKIYQFNDYILSYDKSLNDRSCLIISKIQNGEMYLMGELFDGSADVVSMILDKLQTTVNACKQEKQQLKEWLEEVIDYEEYDKVERDTFKKVLSKIQEIEGDTNE